ncbi:uncharacterized protein At2g39920-like [Cynara cardunculus var. scolymus]|uniref:Acid phosphatase (Class B) n=1 Tax=Cynara cardunculus var. scolymus TaxID=59895 RepID=A0A103YIP4_CYNCS|nr:uncharacterized protein At2g39920-like [Cynara cardunculus var. scolymus]XP_024977810.1 uncharacterized protein At2g39920-like [Cynara cardunculus var. scolymus]KVI09851.1 Acid phosphatase (Class B) [Cynara cardunculus var. scolymus]
MSAYGHQMEREYSARSLTSAEGSDMGSQFRMESVIYMSSCAATIFIGSLVIVGILLMTLLIALTVMLQSCQSREAGVLESFKSDHNQYDHCRMAAFHSEINSFEGYSLPEFCKDVAVKYIKEGHYMRELNISVSLVENYFNGVTPDDGGRDVVLMDTDDFLPDDSLRTNPLLYGYNRYGCNDCVREAKHMKHVFLIRLYLKLQSDGWPLILLSRKPEKLREVTIENLTSAGCGGYSKLIMRTNEEMKMDTRNYFSSQKMAIQAEGYHIKAVISSQMDALIGSIMKTQNFKIPNPLPISPTESIKSTEQG